MKTELRTLPSSHFKNRFGRFHLLLYIVLQASIYFSCFNLITFSFQKRRPDAICIPKESKSVASLCTEKTFCDTVNFNRQILYSSSLNNWAMKYQLYCGNEIYLDYLSSVFFICILISNLVLSPIADYYGRINIIRFQLSLILIGNIIMFFGNSLTFLFIGGVICFLGNHVTILSAIMFKEFFNQNTFTYNISIMNIIFSFLSVFFSYYINTFLEIDSLILLTIIIISSALVLNFIAFFESPCWLEQRKGNFEQLLKNYKYLIEFDNEKNKDSLIQEFSQAFIEESEENLYSKGFFHNLKQLFSSEKDVRMNFFFCIYFWVFNQIPFYALLLNLDTINKLIPMAIEIFFSMDIVGNVLVGILSNTYGRKPTMFIGAVISGITALTLFFCIRYEFNHFNSMLFLIMTFFKFISGNCVYFYVQELFEPNIVTTAVSYSKLPSKLVIILVPLFINVKTSLFLWIFSFTVPIPFILFFTKETLKEK